MSIARRNNACAVQAEVLPPASRLSRLFEVHLLDRPFIEPPRRSTCAWRRRRPRTFGARLDLHGDGELEPQREPLGA